MNSKRFKVYRYIKYCNNFLVQYQDDDKFIVNETPSSIGKIAGIDGWEAKANILEGCLSIESHVEIAPRNVPPEPKPVVHSDTTLAVEFFCGDTVSKIHFRIFAIQNILHSFSASLSAKDRCEVP